MAIDPTTIDFQAIAVWGSGITTVLGGIGAAAYLAIRNARRVASTMPPPVTMTSVYTTDGVAMQALTGELKATAALMAEGNLLRREATEERRGLHQAMDENTAACDRLTAAVSELRTDVKGLTLEIVRSGK